MHRRLFTLIFNLMLVTNISSAQILDLSIYPFLKIKSTLDITSQSDGMGMLEFILDDPIRDAFINPAKSYLVKNNSAFLSLSHTMEKTEMEQSSYLAIYDYTRAEERYTHFSSPIGGVFRFDKFLIGAKISYQFTESKSERVVETYQKTVTKTATKETGYPFAAFMAYELSDRISFGLGVDKRDLKEIDTWGGGSSTEDKIDELVVRGGLNFKMNDTDKWSVLLSYYEMQRDYSLFKMNKGWVLQSDYRHNINEAIGLGGTFAFDKKKMDDYDGYGLKLGIGGTFRSGDILLASEATFEPGWLIYEREPKVYGEYYFKLNYKFLNWRIRSGVQVDLSDRFKWRFGFEYFKYRNDFEGKSDTVKFYYKPLNNTFITGLTTGLEYSIDNFNLVYNFNYRSETHLVWFSSDPQQGVFNPIYNRLILIYNF